MLPHIVYISQNWNVEISKKEYTNCFREAHKYAFIQIVAYYNYK